MLTTSDRKSLDPTAKAINKAHQMTWNDNREWRDRKMTEAAKDFAEIFQAKGFVVTPLEGLHGVHKSTTWTKVDANKPLYFKYQDENRSGMRATMKLSLGVLAYTLTFIENDSWTDDQTWRTHSGNGKVVPVINSELKVGATQEVEDGEFGFTQSLKDNDVTLLGQINAAIQNVNEGALSLRLWTDHFKQYNKAQEKVGNDLQLLLGMRDKRNAETKAIIDEETNVLVTKVTEMFADGMTKAEWKNILGDTDFTISERGGKLKRNSYVVSDSITPLFRYTEEDDVVRVNPPKRSNSKNIVGGVFDTEGNEKRYIERERADFQRDILYTCNHIAVSRFLGVGINTKVEE